jgi:hypothetical protein
VSTRALEAIDRILNRGGDADDTLRAVVRVLADEPAIAWAGIAFIEDGRLVLGPEAGNPAESLRIRLPVVYQSERVAELWADGEAERAFLERVAVLISAHCLVAWDTGGLAWKDVD